MELGQREHHGAEGVGGQVLDVLYARRYCGVRRKGEDEGFDGRVGGEKRFKERKVAWSDENGDGDAMDGELVGKVEERNHVALCWVWED